MIGSQFVLWVGLACAIGGFLWIIGFLIGLRMRGAKVPMRGACMAIVVCYLLAIGLLAGLVLWKKHVTTPADAGESVPVETVSARPLPRVTKVVDGDTFDVAYDGEERIRILGIDTPEVYFKEECYGQEASDYVAQRIGDADVALAADATQGDKDTYGRLLRYVALSDGTDLGLELIAMGYAYEYTYDAPYERQDEYRAAEALAKKEGRGLWSVCH